MDLKQFGDNIEAQLKFIMEHYVVLDLAFNPRVYVIVYVVIR